MTQQTDSGNLGHGIDLEDKERALQARLRSLGSVIVAYSGGVDSAYLAYVAHAVLGSQMLAVIADSASLARSQYSDAQNFAREHGIPLRSIETHELEREAYAVNGPDRCFHCKDELFSVLEQELERTGFEALAYGLIDEVCRPDAAIHQLPSPPIGFRPRR